MIGVLINPHTAMIGAVGGNIASMEVPAMVDGKDWLPGQRRSSPANCRPYGPTEYTFIFLWLLS